MNKISYKNFTSKVLKAQGIVVVDFFASWCGPCKMLTPVLEELSREVEYPIYKVDIDENESLSKKFGILSIPTILVFKDGEEKSRIRGYVPKQAIIDAVNEVK